jgi:pimeloyl-ACP methyl ester carboxylesterase
VTLERTQTIEIDGRRYASRVLGAGPPLVLLNGYSASAADWDPTLLGELASSFTVYAPDHRGMGESELGDPAELSISSMADDVRALMDARGIDAAAVAGWSMGGFVAQRLALDTPDRVSSLTLMASDPGGPLAIRAAPEHWEQLTDHSGTPREQASRLIPLLFPPALVPAIDEAFGDLIAAARAELSRPAAEAQQRAMAEWHATAPAAPDPATAPPVLVMVGTHDVVIPPENDDVLERVWPKTEVDRFAEGGHAFFAIEPTRVAERIRGFARR